MSTTFTFKPQEAWFDEVSVAEQLTAVVPKAKPEPEFGVQFRAGEMSQLSVAVGELKLAVVEFPAHSAVTFEGHVMAGSVVSTTMTVPEQVLVPPAPQRSVTVMLTAVVPSA